MGSPKILSIALKLFILTGSPDLLNTNLHAIDLKEKTVGLKAVLIFKFDRLKLWNTF